MAFPVTNGAMLHCSMGVAPSSLVVLPVNRTLVGGQPAANLQDHVPMVNIMSFGMCISPPTRRSPRPPPRRWVC
jgi:hypothetical protein